MSYIITFCWIIFVYL